MKTIVVPTDFSSTSLNAAHYAADMAAAVGAEIVLIHVVSLPITVSQVPVPSDTIDIIMDNAQKEMHDLKQKLLEYTKQQIKISEQVTMGYLIGELNAIACKTDLFVIIMGTQGAGSGQLALFGSNTIDVMHRLPYPTLVVPAGAHYNGISKVGLACDFQDIKDTIPKSGIEKLLGMFNCTLDILYVYRAKKKINAAALPGSQMLQDTFQKYDMHLHFILNNDIENGIAEFISQEQIDLLLLVPKKHGLFGSIFHKSISKEIALHLHIPVMALHNTEAYERLMSHRL